MTITASETRTRLTELVAEEIRAVLGRKRMSGRELARRMGASYSWVNFRLTGAQEISLGDLQRFAEALEMEYLDLLPREGKLIAVGGTTRPTTRGDLTTAHSPLTQRPRPHGPHGRTLTPSKDRTGRIRANLIAA